MYVGIIELFLEFVKPVTLSMRLFAYLWRRGSPGRDFGPDSGDRAGRSPGLEALLNLIQALIFSVLTLMFILLAVEGHESEEHRPAAAGGVSADHPAPAAPTTISPWRLDRQSARLPGRGSE